MSVFRVVCFFLAVDIVDGDAKSGTVVLVDYSGVNGREISLLLRCSFLCFLLLYIGVGGLGSLY